MTDEAEKAAVSKEEQAQPETEKPTEPVADAGGQVLKNLVILPPQQKKGTPESKETGDAIALPPIRVEEPVTSIRAALGEVCGYSHLTNFRFVLEDPPSTKPSGKNERPTVSPYTGPNAVVSVPVAVKSLEQESVVPQEPSPVLDDFGDLQTLLPQGLQDGSAFRIVLERYDVALIRDHVARLRSLLDGNAPSATSLDEGAEEREKATSSEEEQKSPEGETPDDAATGKGGESAKGDASKEKADAEESKPNGKDARKAPPKDMPNYAANKQVNPDVADLKNFFYLACGEDPEMYTEASANNPSKREDGSKNKKKGKKGKGSPKGDDEEKEERRPAEQLMRETIPHLNQLEEKTRVKCTIKFSGFHPPPPHRKLVGDLAYLEVSQAGEEVIHVTAVPTGFYVNKSTAKDGSYKFDPSPSNKPCFSHELLDCLLQASSAFRAGWEEALSSSKTRAELMATLNEDGPFASLFRVAVRGDFSGYSRPTTASAAEGIDALIQTPSWLVPVPKVGLESEDSWKRNATHAYNPSKTEDTLANNFGVDIRSGTLRDWNEELQGAREMPVGTLHERIDRARVMHKVLADFGEASVLGVRAIWEGQIAPMNPNEATRSQVYLHNNIFFSRAVDAGVETFKLAKGDKAARKSASRDILCLGALHRLERVGLYTLATVLVDYLGTRYVCQSILPGILSGEKAHTLLYGAVEAGCPLMWDKDMHALLEDTLGKSLMIASRPLSRDPLSEERAKEIERVKVASPLYVEKKEEEKEGEEVGPVVNVCAPIEAKGIRGSDQRNYVLDMTRLTPRDANWLPQEQGGTGNWEAVHKEGKNSSVSLSDLDDDEWTLAVLRPELMTSYAQVLMARYLNEKKEKQAKEDGEAAAEGEKAAESSEKTESETPDKSTEPSKKAEDGKAAGEEGAEEKKQTKKTLTESDVAYLKSLRFNVNVFLPDVKSLEGIDEEAHQQIKKDEEVTREVAKHLWEEVIPRVTREIREGAWHQIPHDGKSLTEFIHQYGINCRYLGRLADLAQVEEEKDRKRAEVLKHSNQFERRVMPQYWLELIECEIVARAAKHVLDRYLTENGGSSAFYPAQTVASFLSALISDGEESAAQTENRVGKRGSNEPDEEDFMGLTLSDAGGEGDALPKPIRGRHEVWQDIEEEVGRRFRYTLTLYNKPSRNSRALYPSLLRRVCQRTGVRLAAKSYALGGKCLCSGGGPGDQMMPSHPVAPVDIIDIVPLMKHSAAHGEGFVPCGLGPSSGLPPLHISLPDARATLEAAHQQHSGRALSKALDLAQEACSMYQRVTEAPAHPGVARCLDLMASILFDAGEAELGAANALKALGLTVQIGGFDCPEVISTHLYIFQMLVTAGQMSKAIKHLRAAIYLMELLGGSHHVELSNAYHKAGTVYHGINDLKTALKFYEEADSRESCDKLLEGMISKSTAIVLAGSGEFKQAVETEKRAYQVFSVLLGENHQLTRTSDATLKKFMGAAVQHGNKMVEDQKKQQEEAAAQAIANEIEAEEAAEEEKRKKKGGKKKKGKK